MFQIIDELNINTRLDRIIKRICGPAINQSLIEVNLRNKNITVNGLKQKSNYRTQINDKLYIADSLIEFEQNNNAPFIPPIIIEQIKQAIIFEDEHFIVLNKPANLPCQGGSKVKYSIDKIVKTFNTQINNYKIVHRLDKDTTGVLFIAKNAKIATLIGQLFQNHKIKKKYWAIISNNLPANSGIIVNKISKTGMIKQIVTINDAGDYAETHYKLLKTINNLHLVELTPLTGRTHQIRVHLASLGCPILGDAKYGCQIREIRELHLHAKEVIIDNFLGTKYRILAPVPSYFKVKNFK